MKVEPPRGDPARHMPAFFASVNRGKRSVVLDLHNPDSHRAMEDLIRWADVLVEGFRPGVMERLGFGPETVHALDPRVVYCRISAHGQSGPSSALPAHDLNLQAATGYAHLERTARGPRSSRLPIADLSASLVAVASIQAALAGPRDRIVLDVAMADALQSWTEVWETLDPGELAAQQVHRWPGPLRQAAAPAVRRLRTRLRRDKLDAMPGYGLYRTSDGHVAVGIVDEARFWSGFMDLLGLARHREHSMTTRTLLGPFLQRRIARRVARRPTAHWVEAGIEAGLPITAVQTPADRLSDPQAVHRGRLGRGPLPSSRPLDSAPPSLGEHTVSLLSTIRGTGRPGPS